LKDANLIGTYDLSSKKVNILCRENNSDWQPGSGRYTIQAMKGDKALLAQGGQFRAFSFFNRQTRTASEFRRADYVEAADRVILSTNQRGLEYGVTVGGVWQYQPVELPPQMWQ
jgi:hypothetical protein